MLLVENKLRKLPIGGFLKSSLIDYSGKISAVIFIQQCNMRCEYCHNQLLVDPNLFQEPLNAYSILDYLEKRNKLLDAVVVTGGEACLHENTIDLCRAIKEIGLEVKLDTNGCYPKHLQAIINEDLVDYIAMDLKAKLDIDSFRKVVGNRFSHQEMKNTLESISIIKNSGVKHEFRTTLHSSIKLDHIIDLGNKIAPSTYYLQQVLPETSENKSNIFNYFNDDEFIKAPNIFLRE